jgi:hypothetical protein
VTDSNLKPSLLAVSSNKAKGGNPSKTPGVTFDKRTGRWQVHVNLATGKKKFVGRGKTPNEAVALRADFIAKHGYADPLPKAATMTTGVEAA